MSEHRYPVWAIPADDLKADNLPEPHGLAGDKATAYRIIMRHLKSEGDPDPGLTREDVLYFQRLGGYAIDD